MTNSNRFATLTAREVRLMREAYMQGAQDQANGEILRYNTFTESVTRAAALRYPLPTVTRPRVVQVKDYEYRLVDGVLESRPLYTYTTAPRRWIPQPTMLERTHAINKLLASPTETVEVDDQ